MVWVDLISVKQGLEEPGAGSRAPGGVDIYIYMFIGNRLATNLRRIRARTPC